MHQTSPIKLKGKDVAGTRRSLLEKQGYKCAICGHDCSEEQAVLDHDHKDGHVREVLHRGCNAVEGKIVNAMRRYAIKDPRAFLEGLLRYHEKHSTNQSGLIHPTHKTPEEKVQRVKARAKKKRVAAKKAKLELKTNDRNNSPTLECST